MIICLFVKLLQSCLTLCDPRDCSWPGSSVHVIPGKNTGVGCHFLLQGIFPTQGSNPHLLCLLTWQVGSFPPAPPGKQVHVYIYTCACLYIHHLHVYIYTFWGVVWHCSLNTECGKENNSLEAAHGLPLCYSGAVCACDCWTRVGGWRARGWVFWMIGVSRRESTHLWG